MDLTPHTLPLNSRTLIKSFTMKLTNFLSTLSLIAAVASYPFMADYHAMTDAQKRDYTEMYKRIATRDAAPICMYSLSCVRDSCL